MTESPFEVEIKLVEIENAESFEEARKTDMMKLWISTGEEKFQSAAQLAGNYSADELVGKKVLAAVNLGEVRIAGFKSEALTVGINDENEDPVLVSPEKDIPLGNLLH